MTKAEIEQRIAKIKEAYYAGVGIYGLTTDKQMIDEMIRLANMLKGDF